GGSGTGVAGEPSAAQPAAKGASPGWPRMTPPDLPARPRPRASITDVVPRQTLVAIAVIVLLAVIGVVIGIALADGGEDDGKAAGKGAGATAEASAGPSTKNDDKDGTGTDGSATESAGTG